MADEARIAVFVDYENLALGSRGQGFDLDLVLKRLLEKGRIVYKRAYCDWGTYRDAVRDFHALGVELVDIPRSRASGKNSADIHMVVDALDLSYSKQHIEIFALLTGDSDFSPLASKLKENDKRVVGCGVRDSTSNLLIASCDEFIYYDDLVRARKAPKKASPKRGASASSKARAGEKNAVDETEDPEAITQLMEIIHSLDQDYDVLWGSMIKQTIRRVHPSFSETNAGYRNFGELLKDAEERGYIHLEHDERRGNYEVRLAD